MVHDYEQKPFRIGPYELRENRPSDENLVEFAENLKRGFYKNRLVIFLGAGASIGSLGGNSGEMPLPTAMALRNELWERFMLPMGTTDFDFTQLGAMSLDQASAFAEVKAGRHAVAEFIAYRFRTAQPLWQHAVLPFLNPRALFTTNYDRLIEQGWRASQTKEEIVPIFAGKQQVVPNYIPLFKPHGSADRALDAVGYGGPVITTIDYFEMLSDKKMLLDQWLATVRGACVLFIGYSMSDMDIGAHLYSARQKNDSIHWYAAFPRADTTVRKYWEGKLRIRPIDRGFAEFMKDLDEWVDFIPKEWKWEQIEQWRQQGAIQ
uniref:SIR2-like domain-containing protein n=1 Tax=Candidatus Kentrum sp. FM TaxID=2126340 RepID=A0A450SNL8_9GAMM|nr:MAG: SIR2-like domain-containing protein [Candidatus Kentron sp. FM]VFJ55383.1 MAG: SIR2-like domain-containing protein [Candidatus Kentron sp. FM]VFK10419.1 MAG: SIR2-like domain-containing protein [Candidatus Kentron sp. FM]